MTFRLFVGCLLSLTLVAPGCKGVAKGAAKAAARAAREAEETDSASERESRAERQAEENAREFERRLARLNRKTANTAASDAPLADDAARLDEVRSAHALEAESAWTAYLARRPEELDAPEQRLRTLVATDAALPESARLPPLRLVEVRHALALHSIGRGDSIGAMSLLLKAAVDVDAISTVYDTPAERAKAGNRPREEADRIHRLGEELSHGMGRFDVALDRIDRRLAADPAGERRTPHDLARYEEFSALVGTSPPRLDDAALERLSAEPEALAVASAYRAIAHLTHKARGPALKELERAEQAARAVTRSTWRHQTLGTPFKGESAEARCASRFHEAVRHASFPSASAVYLVGPLVGLRLCTLGIAAEGG